VSVRLAARKTQGSPEGAVRLGFSLGVKKAQPHILDLAEILTNFKQYLTKKKYNIIADFL